MNFPPILDSDDEPDAKKPRRDVTPEQMQKLVKDIQSSSIPKWTPPIFLETLAELAGRPISEFIHTPGNGLIGTESLFEKYSNNYERIETALPSAIHTLSLYADTESELEKSLSWRVIQSKMRDLRAGDNEKYVRFDYLKMLVNAMTAGGEIILDVNLLTPESIAPATENIFDNDEKNNANQKSLTDEIQTNNSFDIRSYVLYIFQNAKEFVYNGLRNASTFSKKGKYLTKTAEKKDAVTKYMSLLASVTSEVEYESYLRNIKVLENELKEFGEHFDEAWIEGLFEKRKQYLQEISQEYDVLETAWRNVRASNQTGFRAKSMYIEEAKNVLRGLLGHYEAAHRAHNIPVLANGEINMDQALRLFGSLLANVVHAQITRIKRGAEGENKTPGAIKYLTAIHNDALRKLQDRVRA